MIIILISMMDNKLDRVKLLIYHTRYNVHLILTGGSVP